MDASIVSLKKSAQRVRKNILDAGNKSSSAHFGGSLSIADILTYLYSKKIKYDIQKPCRDARDRFVLSKGHCALGLYAALCEFGFISNDELLSYNESDGDFPTHAVMNVAKGIEVSSGSLGMGLSFSIGQAIALRKKNLDNIIYVLVGNGEANEGSFWEALMFAGHKKISNLCLVLDSNKLQNDGASASVLPVDNWAEKIRAFGWKVVEADGHDFASLDTAFSTEHIDAPLAIVANTVKGKGVSFMENNGSWHHAKMTPEQYEQALKEIEFGE